MVSKYRAIERPDHAANTFQTFERREYMEIELGKGDVLVGGLLRDDKCFGVIFRKVDQQHTINETDPEWKEGNKYNIADDDVVIWIPSLDSARVVLDRISIINLQLNGFKVIDIKQHNKRKVEDIPATCQAADK